MITESLLHQIDKGRQGDQWGYSMGLPKLEEIIDGVSRGVYTLIVSPTGTGKSSLALYSYVYKPLMEHLEDNNFRVSYFSLEMSSEIMYAKLLSMYIFEKYGIELSTKEILSRKKGYKLSDEYYKIIQECIPWLQKVEKIVTIYDKALSAKSLYTILMKELENTGSFEETETRTIYHPNNENLVHLVIIDHMSLARRTEGRTLKEEIDLISAYLVTLRDRCKISPVVIMQANRNSTSIDRRKEGLNNLRIDDVKDSGAPAQDSEVMISIFNPHREKLNSYRGYDIKQLESNYRTITILKNRYGEADIEVGCAFYGKISYFAELPKPDEIYDYEKYKTPNWILNKDEKGEKQEEITTKSYKFTL